MTNVDQFESLFRSAAKEVFKYREIETRKILVVTDLEGERAAEFQARVKGFLAEVHVDAEWIEAPAGSWSSVHELLEIIGREEPDLLCTYRNLKSEAWRWPYSLGEYVDVMTQVATAPVLLLPHPDSGRAYSHAFRDTDVVMAVTNHLTGDADLVNWAVHFTRRGGKLFLTHIEDSADLARYATAISKIPSIDTDSGPKEILKRLLGEPRDYVRSCRAELDRHDLGIETDSIVALGHRLTEYRRVIEEHEVDLLVFHTKDDEQLAMHGVAYALAVELREIPLLMI